MNRRKEIMIKRKKIMINQILENALNHKPIRSTDHYVHDHEHIPLTKVEKNITQTQKGDQIS